MTFQRKVYLLCLSILFCGVAHADLDSDVQNLGTEVDVTTRTEAQATDLLAETNATQSALFIGSVLTATAGQTVIFPVKFIPGPKLVSALQADILLSSGISVSSVMAGPAATAAGKTVAFSGNPSNPILLFGLNQTAIGEGEVILIMLTLSSALGPGLYPVVFSNPVASDPNGKGIPICVTSGIINVL